MKPCVESIPWLDHLCHIYVALLQYARNDGGYLLKGAFLQHHVRNCIDCAELATIDHAIQLMFRSCMPKLISMKHHDSCVYPCIQRPRLAVIQEQRWTS